MICRVGSWANRMWASVEMVFKLNNYIINTQSVGPVCSNEQNSSSRIATLMIKYT